MRKRTEGDGYKKQDLDKGKQGKEREFEEEN
jgi:hypothetical protein